MSLDPRSVSPSQGPQEILQLERFAQIRRLRPEWELSTALPGSWDSPVGPGVLSAWPSPSRLSSSLACMSHAVGSGSTEAWTLGAPARGEAGGRRLPLSGPVQPP